MKKSLHLIAGLALTAMVAQAEVKTINDPFFDKVDFIGAIGTEDWTQGWTNYQPDMIEYPATTQNVTGEISGTVNWTADKVYLLQGFVYVVDGGVLNIEAGTIVRGEKSSMGSLIIERGGKINANGTSNNPVIFTSNEDAGSRVRGDWGGLIICGKAIINQAGGEKQIEGGPRSFYGGTDDADNSGKLNYVRVEFAGYPFLPDQEINGITFGAVGSGTEVNFCQVSFSNDDSYEWFGGTVNCKHLIAFRGWDDDFDTDFGFRGMIQFAIGSRDSEAADKSESNGFESDNDKPGSDLTPLTQPIFSNISLFGPKETSTEPSIINAYYKSAMHIRRNSALSVYNSVFAGWPNGLKLDGSKTEGNAITSNILKVEHNILSGMGKFFVIGKTATTIEDSLMRLKNVRDFYTAPERKNDTIINNVDLKITDPFYLDEPNFAPMAGSPVLKKSIWYVDDTQVNSVVSANNISVYPNPVINELHVSNISNNSSVEVLNLVGQKVKTTQITSNSVINVADLNSGIYFINVITNSSNVASFKIIKK